ncbi:MAG: ROK family protein [Methylacidiphilales bacterium]|nr:ROK family protein [Candidatus Methylacidiphilales bacterium]
MNTVGVDIGGTQIKLAVFSPEGVMLGKWTRDTHADDPGQEHPPKFAHIVRDLLEENVPAPYRIGIAAPGLAAKDGRSIAFMPARMHGIANFDWTIWLDHEALVPVLNDAHAALLGEVWRGAGTGCRDAVLITLGTGVGGAILSDGRLLKGVIGRAGHFGHVSISDDGEQSMTGTPGALEPAIGNYTVARRSNGRFSSTRELVEAHVAGDAEASSVWLKSVRALARAITSLINLFDPEMIIIGGGVAQAGKALFQPLSAMLDEVEWRPAGHRVRIVPAQLGEWAGAYGAAWNALNL